jgi:hypothetical protein
MNRALLQRSNVGDFPAFVEYVEGITLLGGVGGEAMESDFAAAPFNGVVVNDFMHRPTSDYAPVTVRQLYDNIIGVEAVP